MLVFTVTDDNSAGTAGGFLSDTYTLTVDFREYNVAPTLASGT